MKPPKLKVEITKKNYERAVIAHSGSCLVADAIKEQYPQLSHVSVDVATIRATDRAAGKRYIYLTPTPVAEVLLFFDQGWREESLPRKLRIGKPVRVLPITKSASSAKAEAQRSATRLVQLELKEKTGEPLTGHEQRALTQLRTPKKRVQRAKAYGPRKVKEVDNEIIVHGGTPARSAKDNPNLLHSTSRQFGAKNAQPNAVLKKVIDDAVTEAVAADRIKRKNKD